MTTFRGLPACSCLAEWLPVYERMLRFRGVLGPDESFRIYQLIGGAKASGGTHADGGAFDITDLVGDLDVKTAREMGADATWARTREQGFTPHLHGVLTGCPHNGPAAYQIDAVRDGYNGLGRGGRGAPDDGPRPLSGRTWRQGIEWAERQMENDMANSDEILAAIEKQTKLLRRNRDLLLGVARQNLVIARRQVASGKLDKAEHDATQKQIAELEALVAAAEQGE